MSPSKGNGVMDIVLELGKCSMAEHLDGRMEKVGRMKSYSKPATYELLWLQHEKSGVFLLLFQSLFLCYLFFRHQRSYEILAVFHVKW